MLIDGCTHDFATLANEVLPKHLESLNRAMQSPSVLSDFAQPGIGTRALLKAHKLTDDFSGCYVFIEESKPLYVGISRKVFQRLRSHVNGGTHYSATLAFRMAESAVVAAAKAVGLTHTKTREAAMKDEEFKKHFLAKRSELRKLRVAWTAIQNPVELYLFEVYASMQFQTGQWNTFETH